MRRRDFLSTVASSPILSLLHSKVDSSPEIKSIHYVNTPSVRITYENKEDKSCYYESYKRYKSDMLNYMNAVESTVVVELFEIPLEVAWNTERMVDTGFGFPDHWVTISYHREENNYVAKVSEYSIKSMEVFENADFHYICEQIHETYFDHKPFRFAVG